MSTGSAAPAEPRPVFHARLMQNFAAESPFPATSRLIAPADASGNPVVYSVSNAGSVYAVREDPNSESGWSQSATGLQCDGQIAAGIGARGGRTVIAPAGTSLRFVEEDRSTGVWSPPQPIKRGAASPVRYVKATPVLSSHAAMYALVFCDPDPAVPGPPYEMWCGPWNGAQTDLTAFTRIPHLVDSFAAEIVQHGAGPVEVAVPLTPQLFPTFTAEFDERPVYTDAGSGAPMNLTILRARVKGPFRRVGDCAVGDERDDGEPPQYGVLTLASVEPVGDRELPLLMPPDHYEPVWNDSGGTTSRPGSIWRPVRDGYRALGDVATFGYEHPPTGLVRVVREDLTAPAVDFARWFDCHNPPYSEACNVNLIYANYGSAGEPKPMAVDLIASDPLHPSIASLSFHAHEDYNRNPGPAYGLRLAADRRTSIAVFTLAASDAGSAGRAGEPSPVEMIATSPAKSAFNAFPWFFGIGADEKLYFTDGTQWVLVDGTGSYRSLAASLNDDNPEVFAIGTDRCLYHVRQIAPNFPHRIEWSTPLRLGPESDWSTVATVVDEYKQSYCFAVTASDDLFCFVQDPATLSWTMTEVDLEDTSRLLPVYTYTTEITWYDAAGALLPLTDVRFSSEETVIASINGRKRFIDAERGPITVTTSAAAQLIVTIETTTLHAPRLHASTAAMLPGESVSIDPNEEVRRKLVDVDGETLIRELDTPNAQAGPAAEAIRTALSLTARAAPPRPPKYLDRNRSTAGLAYHAPGDPRAGGRLDLAAVPDQRWILDLGRNHVAFRTLTAKEGAETVLQMTRRAAPARGVFDWIDDLADLVFGFASGYIQKLSVVVEKVGDAIQVTAHFVIGELRYYLMTTIDTVSKVFDIVQAVFDAIAAKFEQLVAWLGFLFDFDDIRRTKVALAHMYEQTFEFIRVAAKEVKRRADAGLDLLIDGLDRSIDDLIEKLLAKDPTLSALQTLATEPPEMSAAAGTNIVFHALQANEKNARVVAPARAPWGDDLPPSIEGLIDRLRNEADRLDTSAEFQQVLSDLLAIGDHPDRFMDYALAALLRILKALATVRHRAFRGQRGRDAEGADAQQRVEDEGPVPVVPHQHGVFGVLPRIEEHARIDRDDLPPGRQPHHVSEPLAVSAGGPRVVLRVEPRKGEGEAPRGSQQTDDAQDRRRRILLVLDRIDVEEKLRDAVGQDRDRVRGPPDDVNHRGERASQPCTRIARRGVSTQTADLHHPLDGVALQKALEIVVRRKRRHALDRLEDHRRRNGGDERDEAGRVQRLAGEPRIQRGDQRDVPHLACEGAEPCHEIVHGIAQRIDERLDRGEGQLNENRRGVRARRARAVQAPPLPIDAV